jgi:hypothetical protein
VITEALALTLGFILGMLTVIVLKPRPKVDRPPGRHRVVRKYSPSGQGYWDAL